MDLNTVKIVVDSSADLTHLDTVPFQSVPLRIITAEGEYPDDAALNVEDMVDHLAHYKGRSSTACPSPEDWLNAFGEAEQVFCITITGSLSGSYNAACTASDLYREAHPERQVFVFDSLTAGPEIALMVEHLREKILSGASFDGARASLIAYAAKTGVVFMLESMKNLANNGRVSPLVARMAGLLGIRVVGKAGDHGTLEPIHKCRGEARALESLCSLLKELGWKQGRIRIAHCFNEEAALRLREMIRAECAKARVEISRCRGLCSFYAERGGLLVGFEKA